MATTMEDVDLEGLSDVEVTMDFTNFTNPKEFSKALRAFFNNSRDRDPAKDHTALITRYPNNQFTIDDDEQALIPPRRKALYFQDSQILHITMPGGPHELAVRKLGTILDLKLADMGCIEEMVQIGGTTMSIDNVRKEADASWGPFKIGPEFPYATCVFECGMSESNRALSRDARLWLEHESSHVTQVVTIKIYQRPEVVFTVWTRTREQRETRSHHTLQAVIDQEVTVTLQAGRPMAEGKLCLSFEKMFERKPRPGTAEGDLNFSARELGGIARMVWAAMGFDIE
jgi:hypothetical protein